MRPRRRLFIRHLLAWGLLLLSAVSACGRTTSDEQATITFACPSGDMAAYQALADRFSEQHPHDVRVQLRPEYDLGAGLPVESTNSLELRLQLLRARATRSDVFLAQSDELSTVGKEPPVLDLTLYFQEDGATREADFSPAALAAFRTPTRLYALPVAVDPIVMVYDRDLFDRGQVPYPEPGWTWNEFLQRAGALTLRSEEDFLQYGYADTPSIGVLAWLYAHGASLWREGDESGFPSPNLNDQRVAEALQWYVDLALEHRVMPTPLLTEDPFRLWDLRQERRVAMWSDGLSAAASYIRSPMQKDAHLGLAPLPQESAAAFPGRVWGYAVSAGTSHPQACWEWISFLSQQAVPTSRFGEAVPARISLAEETAYWDQWSGDDAQAIVYALDHAAPASEWAALGYLVELDAVFNGQSDVDTFLTTAQQRALADTRSLVQATPAPPVVVNTPQASDADQTTVRLISLDTSLIDVYRLMAEAFMVEYPELNVEVKTGIEVFGFDEKHISTEMLAQEADIFVLASPASSTPSEEARQYLLELTPFIASDDFPLDDFISPARPLQHGQVWGIPLTVKVRVAYFNQTLFNELEVSPPVVGWTWDDLIVKAKTITDRGGASGYFGFSDTTPGLSHFYFLFAEQAPLVDMTQSPPRFLLDSVDMGRIGRQWVQLNQDYGPGLYTRESGDDSYTLISMGRVGMWIGRSEELCQMRDNWPFEVGIVPLPRGSEVGVPIEVRTVVISAQTEHPHAAWLFVRYLSDHALAGGCRIPVRWSNLRSDAYHQQVDEAMSVMVEDLAIHWDAYQSLEGVGAETLRYYGYASTAAFCFGEAMSKVENGMELQQALQEAQQCAEEMRSQIEDLLYN